MLSSGRCNVAEDERLCLDISECGRLLGVSRSTAYAMYHSGRLPAIKVSARRAVVPRRALEALLDSATMKPEE